MAATGKSEDSQSIFMQIYCFEWKSLRNLAANGPRFWNFLFPDGAVGSPAYVSPPPLILNSRVHHQLCI